MGKIVFLAIIAVLCWVLFKGLGKKSSKPPKGDAGASGDRTGLAEQMVKCHRCGVLMPESESMMLDGNVSCHDPAHCLHRA
ncbi:MAG: hypothetical protein LH481_05560 [Burkholderiales bacterium]|nr:hypothetical protein [Burkholderiales bacterium]